MEDSALEDVPVGNSALGNGPLEAGGTTPGAPQDALRAIEAVLMVAVEPVPPRILAELLEARASEVESWCEELAMRYEQSRRGFQIVKVAGGYRFQSHPELHAYVERFVNKGPSARLSAAALETLAIIAYRQPLSRGQIAAIRGVNSDGVVRSLLQHGYIEEAGHAAGPGRPVLLRTTPSFLERLGLASLRDLPPVGDLVPSTEALELMELELSEGG